MDNFTIELHICDNAAMSMDWRSVENKFGKWTANINRCGLYYNGFVLFNPSKEIPENITKNIRVLLWFIRGDKTQTRFAVEAKLKIGNFFVIDPFHYEMRASDVKSAKHPFEFEIITPSFKTTPLGKRSLKAIETPQSAEKSPITLK